MNQTTTLLRGGQPVAKAIPMHKKSITGAELAKKLRAKNLIPEENAENWLLPVKDCLCSETAGYSVGLVLYFNYC